MSYQTAQVSYADSYTPPSVEANDDSVLAPTPNLTKASTSTSVASDPTSTSVSNPTLPTTKVDQVSDAVSTTPISQTEKIEDQNIFFLLGVKEDQATSKERELFLDELQQVIWEDFLENDVQLLLTRDEMNELKNLLDKTQGASMNEQEEIVVFLERLIPDLEEIMLEKALELKADMFKERIRGARERYAGKVDQLAKIDQAEVKMKASQWYSAAQLLNQLS